MVRRWTSVVYLAFACLMLNSSMSQERGVVAATGDPFEAVVEIARQLVAAEAPQWSHALSWPVAVADGGTHWKVQFSPPEIMEGGPPIFHLEKGTLRLLRVERQQ